MRQQTDGTVIAWKGSSLGATFINASGTLEVDDRGDTLDIFAKIEDERIPLGTLSAQDDGPNETKFSFSAHSAKPGIRFKFLGVEVHRQVPVEMKNNTHLSIACGENQVKAVIIQTYFS